MNIKKTIKSLSIIGAICAGIILAPTSVFAEKHHSDKKHHHSSVNKKHVTRNHNHKKHVKHHVKHHKGHKRGRHFHKHHGYKKHHRHGKGRYTHHHNPRKHTVSYSYHPNYYNAHYWNDGFFTFGYQNDHFGFTYRD